MRLSAVDSPVGVDCPVGVDSPVEAQHETKTRNGDVSNVCFPLHFLYFILIVLLLSSLQIPEMAPDTTCSNGIPGVESVNGKTCCMAYCIGTGKRAAWPTIGTYVG